MADAILTSGCLYKLTFPNGKAYIGITRRTAGERFKEHCKSARLGKKLAINEAIHKYGSQSVQIETLACADWKYLVVLEVAAIDKFKTKGTGGYNLTTGGEGVIGFSPSAETRQKLREANLGKKASEETKAKMRAAAAEKILSEELRAKYRNANLGKKHSEESRARMSAAQKGKSLSESQKQKLRVASLGRKHDDAAKAKMSAANIGRVMTDEHIANLRASATGRVMSPESIAKQWATRRANKLAAASA